MALETSEKLVRLLLPAPLPTKVLKLPQPAARRVRQTNSSVERTTAMLVLMRRMCAPLVGCGSETLHGLAEYAEVAPKQNSSQ